MGRHLFVKMRPFTGSCPNFTFSNKLLIDSWRSISKSVSHISSHGFKCVVESVIPTGKSEYIAYFRFASVFYIPDDSR